MTDRYFGVRRKLPHNAAHLMAVVRLRATQKNCHARWERRCGHPAEYTILMRPERYISPLLEAMERKQKTKSERH